MSRIFISYRRDDSAGYAGRLYDRLSDRFGEDQIFMDIDTIEPGLDFVEVIEEAVGSCDALIALIGKQWLTITDATGRRRLDNPEDFVRLEIATALDRSIRVIPVLVRGATMPRSQDLPKALRKLARRNALEISDTRFHHDVNKLIEVLETVLATSRRLRPPRQVSPRVTAPKAARPTIAAGEFFEEGRLYYAKTHEWVRVQGDEATCGISDYAQTALSDIVYVELPEVGDHFAQGEPFGSVESVLAASNVYAPLSGTVIAINEKLYNHPERVNADPYGKGWFIKIAPDNLSELRNLMDDSAY
jgi:glycine cleavage system H protein